MKIAPYYMIRATKPAAAQYTCTMQVLYIVCRGGWNFCSQHQAGFAGFKSVYTPAYIAAAQQAVSDAEAIETQQQRNARSTGLRLGLKQSVRRLCDDWQVLKRYVSAGFTGGDLRNALLDAGAAYYARAGAYNWENLQSLSTAANEFISQHQAFLVASCYMPPTFPERFAASAQAYTDLYRDYFDTDRKKTLTASDKVAANNAIYATLCGMLADAARLYRGSSPAFRRQFTFAHLLALAQGGGAGSLRGTITNGTTGAPLQQVTVAFAGTTHRANTGSGGTYRFGRLAAGTYTLLLACTGYGTVATTVVIRTGTAILYNTALYENSLHLTL